MTDPAILLTIDGPLARITLNRPEVGNALNDELVMQLDEAVATCDDNPDIRAILLSGAGKTFCVGGDLNYFAQYAATLAEEVKRLGVHLHNAISRMARMDAPVIAMAHGNVAGAGVSLMAAADLVMAADNATFYTAYTNIGLSPDGSSTYFLPRLIGPRRALDMVLTNRRIDAAQALDWGLISHVAPAAELEAQAVELATQLAHGPTKALGAAKRLIRNSWNMTLEDQMEAELESFANMTQTEDFMEGVMAFMQKREAKFRGK